MTVTAPWDTASRPRANAIVTQTEGLAIGVTAADCGPILFVDPSALNSACARSTYRTLAVRSVSAGADIVLYGSQEGGRAAYQALLAAAESGQLSRTRLLESHQRLVGLKAKLAPVSQ